MNMPLRLKIIENYKTHWRFARQIGFCESMISQVLHGRRNLSEADKQKWAGALKCRVKDIFLDEA